MTQEPMYYEVAEVIEELRKAGLRFSKDTVRRWAREERIPALRLLNGEWRIRVEAVEAITRGEDPHEAVRLADATEGVAA